MTVAATPAGSIAAGGICTVKGNITVIAVIAVGAYHNVNGAVSSATPARHLDRHRGL